MFQPLFLLSAFNLRCVHSPALYVCWAYRGQGNILFFKKRFRYFCPLKIVQIKITNCELFHNKVYYSASLLFWSSKLYLIYSLSGPNFRGVSRKFQLSIYWPNHAVYNFNLIIIILQTATSLKTMDQIVQVYTHSLVYLSSLQPGDEWVNLFVNL